MLTLSPLVFINERSKHRVEVQYLVLMLISAWESTAL